MDVKSVQLRSRGERRGMEANNKLRYRDCISMSLHSFTLRRVVFISKQAQNPSPPEITENSEHEKIIFIFHENIVC